MKIYIKDGCDGTDWNTASVAVELQREFSVFRAPIGITLKFSGTDLNNGYGGTFVVQLLPNEAAKLCNKIASVVSEHFSNE